MKKGKIGKAIVVTVASAAGIFGGIKLYAEKRKRDAKLKALEVNEGNEQPNDCCHDCKCSR